MHQSIKRWVFRLRSKSLTDLFVEILNFLGQLCLNRRSMVTNTQGVSLIARTRKGVPSPARSSLAAHLVKGMSTLQSFVPAQPRIGSWALQMSTSKVESDSSQLGAMRNIKFYVQDCHTLRRLDLKQQLAEGSSTLRELKSLQLNSDPGRPLHVTYSVALLSI